MEYSRRVERVISSKLRCAAPAAADRNRQYGWQAVVRLWVWEEDGPAARYRRRRALS